MFELAADHISTVRILWRSFWGEKLSHHAKMVERHAKMIGHHNRQNAQRKKGCAGFTSFTPAMN